MIYISSACSSCKTISQAVIDLAQAGFRHIELTGGTRYYDGYEEDLLKLKKQYGLKYLVHNYFPPPKRNFVLNLASLDKDVYKASLEHSKKAIEFSHRLGGQKIGFHAGFFLNIKPQEIGQPITKSHLFKKEAAIERFCHSVLELQIQAEQYNIDLYIENNVLSHSNRQTFSTVNPFMVTDYASYIELIEKKQFNLLLDIAHLKVSCHSLGLMFEEELRLLINRSNYIHISDNDGLHDQNKALTQDSHLFKLLESYDLSNKTITLEIYRPLNEVRKSYQLVEQLFSGYGAHT